MGEDRVNIIAGATSGLGAEIGKIITQNGGEFIPVGSRNPLRISNVGKSSNKKGEYVYGDLFYPKSEAYKYFMEEVPEMSGVVYLMSCVDMDPIPTETQKDAIDPRTMQGWKNGITPEEKEEVRRKMANEQIEFWDKFLQKLLERKSNKPLTIIFPNSILGKGYEFSAIRNVSHYSRLKNKINKLIEQYKYNLENRNIHIKNIFIGITNSPMFVNRGLLSAEKSAKISAMFGNLYPIEGTPIIAKEPLETNKVAQFIYDLLTYPVHKTPNKIPVFLNNHLNIKSVIKNWNHQRNKLDAELKNKFLFLMRDGDKAENNIEVSINEDLKKWLLAIREISLIEYASKTPEVNINKLLGRNLLFAEEILQSIPEGKTLTLSNMLDLLERMAGNYP